MNTFRFSRKNADSLIIFTIKVNGYKLKVALDTGASHTVIDKTALIITGCDISNTLGTVQFEAAKGIIQGNIYQVHSIEALGIKKANFHLSSYDFLFSNNILEIDGVLGLDFFEDEKICIDFKQSEITIHN